MASRPVVEYVNKAQAAASYLAALIESSADAVGIVTGQVVEERGEDISLKDGSWVRRPNGPFGRVRTSLFPEIRIERKANLWLAYGVADGEHTVLPTPSRMPYARLDLDAFYFDMYTSTVGSGRKADIHGPVDRLLACFAENEGYALLQKGRFRKRNVIATPEEYANEVVGERLYRV